MGERGQESERTLGIFLVFGQMEGDAPHQMPQRVDRMQILRWTGRMGLSLAAYKLGQFTPQLEQHARR